MNFRFPVFLDLTGKNCLVTGEGFEVAGKVQALVDASAHVTYINPHAEPPIEALAAAGLINWEQRAWLFSDLDGLFLLIASLDDNSEIFAAAEQRCILCNSVDDPAHCRFSFGSIHRQGDLTIAISTNGWAPAVAVRLKEKFQRDIGPEYAQLLAILKGIRPEITHRIPGFAKRRALWYQIVDSDALALLKRGDTGAATALIHYLLNQSL